MGSSRDRHPWGPFSLNSLEDGWGMKWKSQQIFEISGKVRIVSMVASGQKTDTQDDHDRMRRSELFSEAIDQERAVGFISYSDTLLSRSVHDMGYALIMVFLYFIVTISFMMGQVREGFLDAMLSAVTTASTAGCGDIKDLSRHERLVCTFLVILGVGVAGGAISIFFNSLNEVNQYAATRQLMRKTQSRWKSTTVAPPSLYNLSFYERCAVRYYKVTSAYYKGKKKLIRYVHSLGLLRTGLLAGDGEVEKSMKAELDEFYLHQLLDVVFYIVLLFLLISTSAIIMHNVEDWNYIDSFYWAVTTISTSGIRQLDAETTRGKQWMIVYIIIGSTTFFFAWFKILYIPIARSEKRTQMEVLNQFSGNLSYHTIHKLMHNDFFDNIPDLKSDSEEIQKGEFVLMVMFLMNKINYNDVRLGLQVFGRLDRLAHSTGPIDTATVPASPPTVSPRGEHTGATSDNDEELQKARSNTALNQEEILQALASQFNLIGEGRVAGTSVDSEDDRSAGEMKRERGASLQLPKRKHDHGDLNEHLL